LNNLAHCSKPRTDGQTAAGNTLWLTLALELLNMLDAGDFAEAESYTEGRPEEKLLRLILDRCRAFAPSHLGCLTVDTK
jgi:hypothetical protein